MSLLTRYLIRQNLFLLFAILLVGTGIYLLTDLFDRVDDFLEAGVGFFPALLYFITKIPMIVAQILPAVFLIALVVQFNLLAKGKELIALYAGGVSPFVLLRFVLAYSLFWACCQFVFSEAIGVAGDRYAMRVWKEQVRKEDTSGKSISQLWFTDKNRIFFVEKAYPEKKEGLAMRAYVFQDTEADLKEIIKAESFTISEKKWQLAGVQKFDTVTGGAEAIPHLELPLKQNLEAFLVADNKTKPEQLPFWDLGRNIKRLQKAGSNVESLLTVWHTKLAYASSIIVMGLLSLVISRRTENIYKAVGMSLLCIFLFYAANTLSASFGKNGILEPFAAAWLTDVVAFGVLLLLLLVPLLRLRKIG